MSRTPLGELDAILGLHLRMAHGAVQRHFTEHSADLGLTQIQVSVLWLACGTPGIAQTDLARTLKMDRATTMAIVHTLEKRGLLVRERMAKDARRIGFRLTTDGENLLAEARHMIASHETWLKSRFDPGELHALTALLRRIYA